MYLGRQLCGLAGGQTRLHTPDVGSGSNGIRDSSSPPSYRH